VIGILWRDDRQNATNEKRKGAAEVEAEAWRKTKKTKMGHAV
jgi:hypothetical protein